VGNRATRGALLERTSHPGVYRRGWQYVAVYRRGKRQRKEFAATFAEARAIKLERDAEAREERRGPILHAYALSWAARHGGSGRDSVREQTRAEYRRLLAAFALSYFPTSVRLGDLDRRALQEFISWLTDRPGRDGRLSDRSIRNALTPLRRCFKAAAREGLVSDDLVGALVLPARRGGRRWNVNERRSLSREQLARLLDEIPLAYETLFVLLASTGLRISEAIALRWCDLDLDASPSRRRVRQTIVRGIVGAPKSRHGARVIPLTDVLGRRLRQLRPSDPDTEELVFHGRHGGPLRPDNLRNRVLAPAGARVPACPASDSTHCATRAPRC
jgi:integrase